MNKEEILEEFTQKSRIYEEFTERLEMLVSALLEEKSIYAHSISSRLKESFSLEKKIDKSTGKYHHLNDITDIAGIRITTYFEDDVDRVAKVIEEEFSIDEENSIDKRQLIDPDRFGYLSLHYIVSLNESRLSLPEYKKFGGLKAEFQIRSILQHAWAEIEHDLGYKNQNAVPRDIRRSFSRLAGLLELADKEFIEIRTDLEKYQRNIANQINSEPEQVAIDSVSLESFLRNSEIVQRINNQIGKLVDVSKIYNAQYKHLDDDVSRLHFLNINSISELSVALSENEREIISFAKRWISGKKYDRLSNSICVFYLCYVLVGCLDSYEKAYEYLDFYSIGNSETRKTDANKIIKNYKQVAASK